MPSLAVLGDSTPAGIGDPLPGGGWRGFGPLLRDALGGPASVRYTNASFPGARVACTRTRQLPAVLATPPEVAVLVVGMNDTLRSDFDIAELALDYRAVIDSLLAVGTTVLTVRFHDHSRVFWLPASLGRALRLRIGQLNTMVDAVTTAVLESPAGPPIRPSTDPGMVPETGLPGSPPVGSRAARVGVLDLDALPGGYHRDSWAVDRLHPSERGHRLLAHGFAALLTGAGYDVPHPVGLDPSGGRELGAGAHLWWLAAKGVPWVWRRSRDLLPYAASIAWRDWREQRRALADPTAAGARFARGAERRDSPSHGGVRPPGSRRSAG